MSIANRYDDMHFMAAVEWSQKLLADLERGWKPPCTSADLDRAYHDALRSMAPEYPDPAVYADQLEAVYADALLHAFSSQDPASCGHLCVPDDVLLPYLRSMGLVCFGDRCLTHFARMVRAELKKDER